MTTEVKHATVASLVGQWRLLSFDLETKDGGDRHPGFGSNPKGRLIVLPTSIMMAILTPSGRTMPKTSEERALAFQTMVAYSGPFKVEGDQLLTSVDITWNEAWGNTVQARTIRLTEPHLNLTSAWAPHPADPTQIVRGILSWVREA